MSKWRLCKVPGCVRTARTKGLCEAHYKRKRLNPQRPIGGYLKKQRSVSK